VCVNGKLAGAIEATGGEREHFADPVGSQRKESLPWARRHALASSTGDIGDDHVLDDVHLWLTEDPPSSGPPVTELHLRNKARSESHGPERVWTRRAHRLSETWGDAAAFCEVGCDAAALLCNSVSRTGRYRRWRDGAELGGSAVACGDDGVKRRQRDVFVPTDAEGHVCAARVGDAAHGDVGDGARGGAGGGGVLSVVDDL
jgi:hypothetical protein